MQEMGIPWQSSVQTRHFHSVAQFPSLVGGTMIPQVSWLGKKIIKKNERVKTEYVRVCTYGHVCTVVMAGCAVCTRVYTCPCAGCCILHVHVCSCEQDSDGPNH